jgi:enamine deaminase RidA (YjgF/YER057c/UK114 family)
MIIIAGQIGWNPKTAEFETDDFTGQVRQALSNIVALLAEAGTSPNRLVRLTWFITDRDAYLAARREIGAAYRELIGTHYPPISVVVVSALIEEQAKVEIEALAVIPE